MAKLLTGWLLVLVVVSGWTQESRPLVVDRASDSVTVPVSFGNTVAFGQAAELTLVAGELTPTTPVVALRPATPPSGELVTVHASRVGQVLWLTVAEPATAVVVVRHGVGNLSLPGAQDISLTHGALHLVSQRDGGWRAVGGGGAGAGPATAGEVAVAATPGSYTAATPDVEAHLAGIDAALGTLTSGGGASGTGWTGAVSSYYLEDLTLASDATSCPLSGWTLQAGHHYRLLVDLRQLGGGSSVAIQINGASDSGQYSVQRTQNLGGNLTGAMVSSNALWAASSATEYLIEAIVSITPEGYAQVSGTAASPGGSSGQLIQFALRRSSAPVGAITSLALVHSTANGLRAGTRVRLYELRDVQGSGQAPRWGTPALDAHNGSLAGYWPLTEWSGTRYDLAHATALRDHQSVGWTSGASGGGAALFRRADGTYLSCGAPRRTATTVFLSCWVMRTTTGNTLGVWGARTTATYAPVWLYLLAGGLPELAVGHQGGTSLSAVTGTTALSVGTWYHLAAWVDSGGQAHLFVNGSAEGTPASLTAPLAPMSEWYLGAYYDGGVTGHFDGAIAGAAVWLEAPFGETEAAALAAALYNGGTPAGME